MSRQYITTAIDYPNAAPHMGHALEKVLADVCARWFRLRGDEVRFQTGTDEHGIKIQQAAQKQGVTPEEFVDQNVKLFEGPYARLGISADIFIRTSDRKVHWPNVEQVRHRPTVEALWTKLQDAGVLEQREYTGLYCTGCERFLTEKDLVDGLCPDHQRAPEKVKERNWFFKLSNERDWLQNLLKKDYHIVPEFRAQETFSLLEGGLEDVSFSRPKTSLSWGIPVPGDPEQTMYVWCDALTNYISGLGFFMENEKREYWDDAEVTHVIGKDIARFHALIWPAMLRHAGVKAPNRLLIHGFITNEGKKMSKSLGNVVVPDDVISTYGVDALRFYLSHEVPVGRDGDFSWTHFDGVYNGILRNKLGNMLNRTLVLLKKDGGELADVSGFPDAAHITDAWKTYEKAMNAFTFSEALQQVGITLLNFLNQYIDEKKPWKMEDAGERVALLSAMAECLRHIALLLLPFTPETAQKISMQLGVPYAEKMLEKSFVITDAMKAWGGLKDWKRVGEPSILFPPIEKAEKKD